MYGETTSLSDYPADVAYVITVRSSGTVTATSTTLSGSWTATGTRRTHYQPVSYVVARQARGPSRPRPPR